MCNRGPKNRLNIFPHSGLTKDGTKLQVFFYSHLMLQGIKKLTQVFHPVASNPAKIHDKGYFLDKWKIGLFATTVPGLFYYFVEVLKMCKR